MAHGPHGEGHRQKDGLVPLAGEPAQRRGDVDVGGGQHAGGVEGVQQPVCGERQVAVLRVDRLEDLAHDPTTPSSRSESSSTSGTGGRHEKTPHGMPSTTGVSGPHMPRR